MSVKGILFSSEMVRAILDGRKSVTRRAVKPQPALESHVYPNVRIADELYVETWEGGTVKQIKAPCRPGDILYVRETWAKCQSAESYVYKADYGGYSAEIFLPLMKWHPSIHMPREAARIWLRVTDVRVERLCDISYEQIVAEGIWDDYKAPTEEYHEALKAAAYRRHFYRLWDSTIKPADRERYGWTANPWVWVIEFERCEAPEEG